MSAMNRAFSWLRVAVALAMVIVATIVILRSRSLSGYDSDTFQYVVLWAGWLIIAAALGFVMFDLAANVVVAFRGPRDWRLLGKLGAVVLMDAFLLVLAWLLGIAVWERS